MKKRDLHKLLLKYTHKIPLSISKFFLKINIFGNTIYGRAYLNYKLFLQKNKKSYENFNDLIKILNHSRDNIPYYKNYPKIDNKSDFFAKTPFIDKSIINNNPKSFISPKIKFDEYTQEMTGGTSGKPLKIFLPKDSYIIELGTMHKLWENVGFKNHTRAVIRNDKLQKNQDYIINPITKEFIFDGFRLNDDYFQKIYNILKKNKIQYIHAYPSTALEFAKFLYNNQLDTSFIKSFLSGSENIYPFQKNFIRDKLNIDFYGWYGHSEKILLGGYCEHNDLYHMEPTYGLVELVDENGVQITQIGQIGEVVATSLHNYGMPLIRYKTGDFAEYAGDYCPECKRHLLLLKNIQGRRDGTKIYTNDKKSFTTGLLEYDKDLLESIEGLQHIQRSIGTLEVYIVKNSLFNKEHEEKFKEYYSLGFYKNMEVKINYVEHLIKHKNGKFVELISEIEKMDLI